MGSDNPNAPTATKSMKKRPFFMEWDHEWRRREVNPKFSIGFRDEILTRIILQEKVAMMQVRN